MLRWFYLGVSLATLLPQPPGATFVRAVLQVLEELQYHFSSQTGRSIKAIRARPAVRGASNDDLTPALQRANGKVLYEYLLTPHVAHGLSGIHVGAALFDMLAKIYRKLAESPSVDGATAALTEAVMRLDGAIEEAVIAPAVHHCEQLSRSAVRLNLGRLDGLFARMWGQAEQQEVPTDTMEQKSGESSLGGAITASL